MGKNLYIAEKPSVAREFANALKINGKSQNGYLESEDSVVTWCVGHLVTMSYPEAYDDNLKKWRMDTLPFLPKEFKYEVIDGVKQQFEIVKRLLTRKDVDVIYVCTDSGREGEYIYRLVEQIIGDSVKKKIRKRVWIDSQTEEEIKKGIATAKDLSAYDNLSNSAYLRAKEDYLMGINFSRIMTLKFGPVIADFLNKKWAVLSIGRVMTCVLGMTVRREREIRDFVKTPFYRVIGTFGGGANFKMEHTFEGEWKVAEGSMYFNSPYLYRENGFKTREKASELINILKVTEFNIDKNILADKILTESMNSAKLYEKSDKKNLAQLQVNKINQNSPDIENKSNRSEKSLKNRIAEISKRLELISASDKIKKWNLADGTINVIVSGIERKKENKNPPLLFNLAELQNECSKRFKISPDETLKITQELYEKKMVTYPRTDARVLSTAVAKEIFKNINGLTRHDAVGDFAREILAGTAYKNIARTRYVNDKQITDHYAIIPTGQGLSNIRSLSPLALRVYEAIARRFLSIFYPPAVYQKYFLNLERYGEHFFIIFKILLDEGYFKVTGFIPTQKADTAKNNSAKSKAKSDDTDSEKLGEQELSVQDIKSSPEFIEMLGKLKKGDIIPITDIKIKEGETSPPKRYNSGSLILAMENAGQLIEDEELRAQIKGSGIGTSATRAEILKKLEKIEYIALNKKTQVVTPSLLGEIVYDVVNISMKQLLNPELTASWEKGLNYVAEGTITPEEYMQKLEAFVINRINGVKGIQNMQSMIPQFQAVAKNYKK